jgi:50S ribosomal subunit-associated GTPase HflX
MFVIYVLDISDSARHPEALDELTKVLKNPDLEGIPMVFLFHKIDIIKNKDEEMQAKLFFSEDFIQSFGARELKCFDTSIYQLNTLDAVKEYLTFHLCELTAALQACDDGTP